MSQQTDSSIPSISQMAGDLVVIQRNPTSGSGRRRSILLALVSELRARRFRIRMFANRGRLDTFVGNPENRCRIRCLVAAGGDGTVSDLVNRHPDLPVAVLPMGTENLLARHLKMPRDGRVVAAAIQQANVRRFDTIQVGNRQFLLMASAGIDAEVVHRLHASRSGHIHHWTYVRPILQTFASYRFPEFSVTDMDTGTTTQGTHVIVSNFREYGFNLKFTPDADPTDGQLDVRVFQGRSLGSTIVHAVVSLFRAQYGRKVIRFRSRHVSLTASFKEQTVSDSLGIPLEADGDEAGHLPVDIQVNPSAMRLIVHGDYPTPER